MANSGAIRAGKAFVEVSADSTPLERGLRRAQARLKAFGDGLRAIGTGMTAVGASVAGALFGAAKTFANVGDALDEASARTGVSVEALSELKYAADLSGASMETLETGIRKMQKTVTEAAAGSASATEALAALGLTAGQLRQLSPEQQFKALAESLSQVSDPTQRAALAMEVFGKSGTQLLPMLQNGAAGLEDFAKQARALGVVMSTEDARAAAALSDALDSLWATAKAGAVAIGGALADELRMYAESLTAALRAASQWIQENRELVVTVAKVAVAVTGIGATLTALGLTCSIVATAFNGLRKAVVLYHAAAATATVATGALSAALTVVSAHPIIAAVSVVAAGIAAIGAAAWLSKSKVEDLGDALDFTNEKAVKAHAAGLLAEWKRRNGPEAAAPVDEGTEPRDTESWARRISQLRIALIEDEHARRIASIEAEYAAEVDKARAAGALQSTFDDIALARKLELAKVEQDLTRERERDAARTAADAAQARAAENLRLQEEAAQIAEANADRAFAVAELELRAKYKGVELEQSLLELQKQRTLLAAKAAGENLDLVEREFELREKLLGMERVAGAVRDKTSVAGIFNPAALAQMMGGVVGAVAPTADKSESLLTDIRSYTKRLAEAAAKGGIAFA